MLRHYHELTQEQIDRAGQWFMFCDADGCENCTEVEVKTAAFDDGETVTRGVLPDGWGTSHPEGDPMRGAANFCPDHTGLLVEPVHTDVIEDAGTSVASG